MREHYVAIHQPNFFPWLGYFDKIRRADTFIFLDDVQFPKTGGVWTNRGKILQGGQARWLTAPIGRNYHGLRRVNDMHFAPGEWREKMLRQLTEAYRAAPFFAETMALITPLILYPEQNIAAYNIHAITALCAAHGLSTRLVTSSSLRVTHSATERLIALTRAVDGTHYLCGGGAEGYQQDELFTQHGVTLTYQNFTPEPYAQQGTSEFIAGLSIIDGLMAGAVRAA